jgi:hypothetical protein
MNEPGLLLHIPSGCEDDPTCSPYAASARRPAAQRRQHLRGADEACDVQVVTAGVHHPGMLGGERHVGPLGDRQRVHVAAKQHHGTHG